MIFGYDTEESALLFLPRLKIVKPGFACRYLSPNAKGMTKAEVLALASLGIKIVSVYETTANRALQGAEAGQEDMAAAIDLAASLGQPQGSPIFLAVDFDATLAQINGPITSYFQGANKEAVGECLVASYGNGLTCKTLKGKLLAQYTWVAGGKGMQGTRDYLATGAWDIQQDVGDQRSLNLGVSIDSDIANNPALPFAWLPAPA